MVDENGLVVAVESVPERTDLPSYTGKKARAKKRRGPAPYFEWKQYTGPTVASEYSAAAIARRLAKDKRRPAKEKAARVGEAEERRRRLGEELRGVERLTDFEKAYDLGITASKASPPNYPLAIAAFSKAYRLDPRRKVKPGRKPDAVLFEVPTRLAAAYRLNGQLYEAQTMYEWVLERHDNRFARVGLAAVHEDNGKHVQALRLYESVLDRYPRNAYALRGLARTLASLGRGEEAREAHEKALRVSGG